MKARHIFLTLTALAGLFTSCKKDDKPAAAPSIAIAPNEMNFEKAASSQTLQVTATREWKTTIEGDWISVTPDKGSAADNAQTVTIAVLENTGIDRTGTVKFDIGFDSKTLTVKQKGSGSAEDLIVYSNDFDKEPATQTYGSGGKSWPYLDQFLGWKNEKGTGAANVTYDFAAMSVRNNSNSNGAHSDYPGSGVNNLFFGKDNRFKVGGIALPADKTDFTLSFGTEKYEKDKDNTFKPSEFHVYVSADDAKWVELAYKFPGDFKNGRWDLASTTFSVPSGTVALHIGIVSDLASAHRLDDLKLVLADAAGTAVDFSKGVEVPALKKPESVDYENAPLKTVAEFIAAADKNTYFRLKGKVSSFNAQYFSFDLTDESGSIYVYSVQNKDDWKDKISDGGTIELAGRYDYYEKDKKHEVVQAHILSFEGATGVKMTVAEALAAEKGTAVILENVLVYAKYKQGVMIGDGTGFITVYKKEGLNAGIGDKLNVTGTVGEYGGLRQIASPELAKVSSGNEVAYPEVKPITAAFDSYASDKPEYITFNGTLNVTQSGSSTYYNIIVAGALKRQGSIQYPLDGAVPAGLNGKLVEVTGFFAGISGTDGKYLNIMMTEIKEAEGAFLTVDPAALTVSAETASAKFKITSNVKWTVASGTSGVTFDKASGEGEYEVTVHFPANTSTTDAVTILVTVTGEGVNPKTVTITQKAVVAALSHPLTTNIAEGNFTFDNGANNHRVKVNGGTEQYFALKLGTAKKTGTSTVKLPAGTKRVGFYAVGWKGEKGVMTVSAGGNVIATKDVLANDGATSSSPYPLVDITDSEHYFEIVLDAALPVETSVTVATTDAGKRAIVFGINTYTE